MTTSLKDLERMAREEGKKVHDEYDLEAMARAEGAEEKEVPLSQLTRDQITARINKGVLPDYEDYSRGYEKAFTLLDKPRSVIMAPMMEAARPANKGHRMESAKKALMGERKTIYPTSKSSFTSWGDTNGEKVAGVIADIGVGLATGKAISYLSSKIGPSAAKQILKLKAQSKSVSTELHDSGQLNDAANLYYENPEINSLNNSKVLDNVQGSLKTVEDPLTMISKQRRDQSTGMMGEVVGNQKSAIKEVGDEIATSRGEVVNEAIDVAINDYTDIRKQMPSTDLLPSVKEINSIVQPPLPPPPRMDGQIEELLSQYDSLKKDYAVGLNTDKSAPAKLESLQKSILSIQSQADLPPNMPDQIDVSQLYDMRKSANKRITDLSRASSNEAPRSQRVYRNLKTIYDKKLDEALQKYLGLDEFRAFKQRDQQISSMMNIENLLGGSRSNSTIGAAADAIPYGNSAGGIARVAAKGAEVPMTGVMKAARLNDPKINPQLNPFGLSGLQMMGTASNIPVQLASFKIPRSYEEIKANKDVVLAKLAQATNDPSIVSVISDAIDRNPHKLETILPAIIMKYPDLFDEDRYGRVNNKILDPMMKQKASKDVWDNANLSQTQKAAKVRILHQTGYLEE